MLILCKSTYTIINNNSMNLMYIWEKDHYYNYEIINDFYGVHYDIEINQDLWGVLYPNTRKIDIVNLKSYFYTPNETKIILRKEKINSLKNNI